MQLNSLFAADFQVFSPPVGTVTFREVTPDTAQSLIVLEHLLGGETLGNAASDKQSLNTGAGPALRTWWEPEKYLLIAFTGFLSEFRMF